MYQITFNNQAVQAMTTMNGLEGEAPKARLDVKDGRLRVRPTDRVGGPVTLVDFKTGPRNRGLVLELNDELLKRLGADRIVEPNTTFALLRARYGWLELAFVNDIYDEDADYQIEGAEGTVGDYIDEDTDEGAAAAPAPRRGRGRGRPPKREAAEQASEPNDNGNGNGDNDDGNGNTEGGRGNNKRNKTEGKQATSRRTPRAAPKASGNENSQSGRGRGRGRGRSKASANGE